MNKDESDFSQAKWRFILEAIKERGIKTPLQFFAYIAKLLTLVVVFAAAGTNKSHPYTILLICALFLIFLIEILIVTSREYKNQKNKNRKLIAHPQKEELEYVVEREGKMRTKEAENPAKEIQELECIIQEKEEEIGALKNNLLKLKSV